MGSSLPVGSGVPGPINGERETRSHCSGGEAMPPFQRAVLVLRAPLWEVSVVCVCVGFGEHPVTPRKGGSHSGQETQFCSSLSEDRKSVPLLPGSHPSPAGPIASAAGQWGHPVPQPQDRGLSPQLAFSLRPSPVLASLPPAPCHCRLPPELSPLDTPAPGHQ